MDNMVRPWLQGGLQQEGPKSPAPLGTSAILNQTVGVTVGALTGHLSGAKSALGLLSLITPFFREVLNPKEFKER